MKNITYVLIAIVMMAALILITVCIINGIRNPYN